jgi:predicted esterase
MRNIFSRSWRCIGLIVMIGLQPNSVAFAQKLSPGEITEIKFSKTDLPPTLYTVMTGKEAEPGMEVRLPDDYDPAKPYPLLVYVPGLHGGPKGNIGNAQRIVGQNGWIVASVPLFKKTIDRSEVAGGILVSMEDYPVISKAYQTMLGKLFELVPNIDREKSAMVGFSNGALTIGVLLSGHDEFVLTHFKSFCLVDNGMFHLTDLHKKYAKDCRYLILVGDQEDMGRELKIRGSKLQQDSWKLLGVNVTCQIMKDTGHEFNAPQMDIVGRWLKGEEPKD